MCVDVPAVGTFRLHVCAAIMGGGLECLKQFVKYQNTTTVFQASHLCATKGYVS
jgi:hypothetical protein